MVTRFPGSTIYVVAIAIAAGLGLAAHAGQPGDGPEDPSAFEPLSVRTATGTQLFYLRDPEGELSDAWRDNRDRAEKSGNVPAPTPGFVLTNRIILNSDSAALIDGACAAFPGITARPVAAAGGYWALEAGTVREAVAIADLLAAAGDFAEVYVDLTPPWALRTLPTDPLFAQQWHLDNLLDPLFDLNAEPAWDAGYTGAGVVIGIVENAWQHTHPDLAANFDPEASQTGGTVSSHATSCAGLAAAVGFNDLMGAGMAYGALLSDQIYGSYTETADALGFRNDLNDIKSNSWGPPDVGQIVYMPAIIRTTIEEAIASGRDGLGEVFVWAAGNGGLSDRVDYDPYASSRFTIAVGAIGDADVRATYNERGSSMLTVAHSSGNARYIATTASASGWTTDFGGTSASAPLAAGVIALMLEARPELTWRDVQHILIESARINDPNHPQWITNGGGFAHNYNYGFGAIDAGAAVALTETWRKVPHELVADTGVVAVGIPIPDNDPNGISHTTTVTENIRIESVELILNVETTFVGDLEISLVGPTDTRSVFTRRRSGDGQHDYVDYLFTSLRHWGEESAGDWTVEIADLAASDTGTLVDYRLVFYGTPVCLGELSGDGEIGLADLAELLAAYRACEGNPDFNPAADFDNSGCVDLSDLAFLLSVYGETCP